MVLLKKSNERGQMFVLRMGNIQQGEIVYDKLVYSNDEDDNRQFALQKYDLLFNRTNSREWVGKVGIYRGEYPAIYAGYLVQVRPIFIDPEYLNYVMNTEYERIYCKRVKSDGINQSNVSASKIADFLVPIPPLQEQQKIVQALKTILPAIYLMN